MPPLLNDPEWLSHVGFCEACYDGRPCAIGWSLLCLLEADVEPGDRPREGDEPGYLVGAH